MSGPEVVTLGEALLVVRPTDPTPVATATAFVLGVAGAESNVAVALSRLGHRAAFIGRTGDDAAGHRIRRALRAEGIDTTALTPDPAAPTGLLVRDLGGKRGIAVDYHRLCSAGSRLEPADIDPQLIEGARFLHVTGLTCGLSATAAAAVVHAASIARDVGTPVVLDPNLRYRLHPKGVWRELLEPVFPLASVVVAGLTELRIACGHSTTSQSVARLRDLGVRTFVLREGVRDTHILHDGNEVVVPVDAVDPVDPVGAGDAFAGGLLSGLLDELPLRDAVVRAHAVARRCVLTPGDTEGLPTRRELSNDGEVTR